MLFTELINSLITDTTQSLPRFGVELCLSATIVLFLLMRLTGLDRLIPACLTATIGALVAKSPFNGLQIVTGMILLD